MAVYTKIFVKFPKKFWPEGKGREFFLYASSRRGYYVVWQVYISHSLAEKSEIMDAMKLSIYLFFFCNND